MANTGKKNFTGVPFGSNLYMVNPRYHNNFSTITYNGSTYPIKNILNLDKDNNAIEVEYDFNGNPMKEWITPAKNFWATNIPTDNQASIQQTGYNGLDTLDKRAQMMATRGIGTGTFTGGELQPITNYRSSIWDYKAPSIKGPAEDIDKVMLGTLGLGIAPVAIPEVATALSTMSIPFEQTIANTLANPYVQTGLTSAFAAGAVQEMPNTLQNTSAAREEFMQHPSWYTGLNYAGELGKLGLDASMFASPTKALVTGSKELVDGVRGLYNDIWDNAARMGSSLIDANKVTSTKTPLYSTLFPIGNMADGSSVGLFDAVGNTLSNGFKSGTQKIADLYNLLSGNTIRYNQARIDALEKALEARKQEYAAKSLELAKKGQKAQRLAIRKILRSNKTSDLFPKLYEQARKAAATPIDFSKIGKENMQKLLEQEYRSDIAKELTSRFDADTGVFNFEYPYGAKSFYPDKVVTTGDIAIKDLATGKTNSYNLKFDSTGGKSTVTYNPATKHLIVDSSESGRLTPNMPKEYQDAIQRNVDYVTQKIIPNSKIFGSSSNIAKGNLMHGSHDIDVIMTEKMARQHPEFSTWRSKRPDTYGYQHADAGEIDVNVIRETQDGRAVGDLAHELYSQLYPKQYRDLMVNLLKKGEKPSTSIPLDISADELYQAYDPVVKGIQDAFASSKSKHAGRALYYLHYGNIDDVERGFNAYANYILGGEYTPTNISLETLEDPAVNSKIIDTLFPKKSGINKEEFINNPRRMKLLIDTAIFDNSFFGRGIDSSRGDILKSFTYWFPETTGGTLKGVGLNTVVGGNSGYGDVYASIVPNRFKPYSGTLEEIEETIRHNLGQIPLSKEDLELVKDIAKKHSIPGMEYVTNLGEALNKTSGRRGKNYKNFINELAEAFDIPAINNGMFGNDPYASLLEDQPEGAVKQLFFRGMDRPQTFVERVNKADGTGSTLGNALTEDAGKIRRAISNREDRIKDKFHDDNYQDHPYDLLKSRGRRLTTKAQEYSDRATYWNKTHEGLLEDIRFRQHKLERLVKDIRIFALAGGAAAVGGLGAKALINSNANQQILKYIDDGVVRRGNLDSGEPEFILNRLPYSSERGRFIRTFGRGAYDSMIDYYKSSKGINDEYAYGGPLVRMSNMFDNGGYKYYMKPSDVGYYAPEVKVTPSGSGPAAILENGDYGVTAGTLNYMGVPIYEEGKELNDNQYRTQPTNAEASHLADNMVSATEFKPQHLLTAPLQGLMPLNISNWIGLADEDNNMGLAYLYSDKNPGFFIGNDPTKPFSKKFAQEHPYWAMSGNLIGDALGTLGVGKTLKTGYGRITSAYDDAKYHIDAFRENWANPYAREDMKNGLSDFWHLWKNSIKNPKQGRVLGAYTTKSYPYTGAGMYEYNAERPGRASINLGGMNTKLKDFNWDFKPETIGHYYGADGTVTSGTVDDLLQAGIEGWEPIYVDPRKIDVGALKRDIEGLPSRVGVRGDANSNTLGQQLALDYSKGNYKDMLLHFMHNTGDFNPVRVPKRGWYDVPVLGAENSAQSPAAEAMLYGMRLKNPWKFDLRYSTHPAGNFNNFATGINRPIYEAEQAYLAGNMSAEDYVELYNKWLEGIEGKFNVHNLPQDQLMRRAYVDKSGKVVKPQAWLIRKDYGGPLVQMANMYGDGGGNTNYSADSSALDWSPESWFSLRTPKPDGTLYNEEEARRLAFHVPEYREIEKSSKANGTWLKMPDGSMWTGDPRSWVMMQSKAFKQNYDSQPWYTGQAEWPTTFDYGNGPINTNKMTRAPYYNKQMWFSDNKDYGQTFADYISEDGLKWRGDLAEPEKFSVKGHNFLAAIPKEGNYRTLESPQEEHPDNWQQMPFELVENEIRRLPSNQIEIDLLGRNRRVDHKKVLTDDVVNWSKDLGDEGIFIQNVHDGPIIKDGGIDDYTPINEFISQPGFTKKVKFIEGNTGDFDINNPYKYAYNWDSYAPINYTSYGGPLVQMANRYEMGGPKRKNKWNTTGGAGYIPPQPYAGLTVSDVRRRLYDNVVPFGYEDAFGRISDALILNKKDSRIEEGGYPSTIDDYWATYLGIPEGERHSVPNKVTIGKANFQPTKGYIENGYKINNLPLESQQYLIDDAQGKLKAFDENDRPFYPLPLGIGENKVTYTPDETMDSALRQFTLGRGYDGRGDYVSYYDKWDIAPFSNHSGDQSFGIGKPFELYDRIYLDDFYGIDTPTHAIYLPEVEVTGNKHSGGGSLNTHKKWEDLSMKERGEMIRVAIRNGITNLSDIKSKYNEFAEGGNLYGGTTQKTQQMQRGSWKTSHQQRWFAFLKRKGLSDADAARLSGFFMAQDGLESAGGTSSAARQKNNYGGMQRNGKNISYPSVEAYMEDKWNMMNSKFRSALGARTIDEYATILGNPDTAGKGYLYYVTDQAKYDPNSPVWRAAQIKHMHNYINGMRSWAGQGSVKFNDNNYSYNQNTWPQGYVYDVLPQLFAMDGVPITVSSGYRPGAVVNGTNTPSKHGMNQAADIVGDFAKIQQVLDNPNSNVSRWMLANGYGYLNETSGPGGTTKYWKDHNKDHSHYHIGMDSSLAKQYAERFNSMPSQYYAQSQGMIVPPLTPYNQEAFYNQDNTSNNQALIDMMNSIQDQYNAYQEDVRRKELAQQEAAIKQQRMQGLSTLLSMFGSMNQDEGTSPFNYMANMLTMMPNA